MHALTLFSAELRRTWRQTLSYRFDAVSTLALWLVAFPLLLAVLDSVTGGYSDEERLASLIGFLVWNLCLGVLASTAREIESEAKEGTLEPALLSPLSPQRLLTARVSASFVIEGVLTLVLGVLLLVILRLPPPPLSGPAIAVFALTLLSTLGASLALGGLTLVYKQIGSVIGIVVLLAVLFTGALVPLDPLGPIFTVFKWLIPTVWGIDALRETLLYGATWSSLWADGVWQGLVLQAALFLLLGVEVLQWGFRHAQRHGSLAAY